MRGGKGQSHLCITVVGGAGYGWISHAITNVRFVN